MQSAGQFTIRRCARTEVGRLSELAARLFAQAYGPTHPEPTLGAYLAESFSVPRLRTELADPAACLLVVEDDAGLLIGYAHLRETDAPAAVATEDQRAVEIVRFYLDASWHGRGAARELMAAAEEEARRRGVRLLWLTVWQQAPRPIAFYRRSGFEIVGTATFRFGERLDDDFLMRKRLTPP
jgi:ribosomal protein S18 acetylase RimI-like enzyme